MTHFRCTDSVRRSLFGPVDHEQLRRDLKLKLQQIMEQDTRRWNFNFEAETPLPGRFQWDEIPVQCAAPFYAQRNDAASKPEHGDQPSEEQSARTDQENRPSVSNTHKSPAEVTPVRRKRMHSRAAAKPRNNARITDFFSKRRRSTETKSIQNPFSSTEAAPCRTIR
ncbi:cyclin-dependent kinase inhibitor 1Ca [Amphiprion ocellaris]|nr:cyclin-dependent kinase inhibitor 1Ca [Amphiprion ocellaris]